MPEPGFPPEFPVGDLRWPFGDGVKTRAFALRRALLLLLPERSLLPEVGARRKLGGRVPLRSWMAV